MTALPRRPMPPGDDPRLRLRLFIGGRLADEEWINTAMPGAGLLADAARDRHAKQVAEAEVLGLLWMVEAFNPAAERNAAYVRIGTDHRLMRAPLPITTAGVN